MKVRNQDREKEQNAKQKTHDDMANYMNTPEKPKLNKDDGQKKNKKETEQQKREKKVDVVKVSEKPDRPQKPEQKEPLPPSSSSSSSSEDNEEPHKQDTERYGSEEDDGRVQVTNKPEETTSKPDTDEVQVTDNNGKPLTENWIRLDF